MQWTQKESKLSSFIDVHQIFTWLLPTAKHSKFIAKISFHYQCCCFCFVCSNSFKWFHVFVGVIDSQNQISSLKDGVFCIFFLFVHRSFGKHLKLRRFMSARRLIILINKLKCWKTKPTPSRKPVRLNRFGMWISDRQLGIFQIMFLKHHTLSHPIEYNEIFLEIICIHHYFLVFSNYSSFSRPYLQCGK